MVQEDPQRAGHSLKIEAKQSGEGRSQDQVPNLQKSLFIPQLVDNSEQSRPVAQHLYDRRHCVRYTAHKPSRTKQGTFPHPHAPTPTAIKKDAPGDVQLMKHFVKSPNYGVDSAAYVAGRRSRISLSAFTRRSCNFAAVGPVAQCGSV